MSPISSRPLAPETFVLGHRASLDGLRGLAVLAVIAQHTGLVTGGVIGVDLFFVLSGFLITTLLLQEQRRTGRISLPRFYLRRCLRLLPALLGMLAGVWLWTLATDNWGGAVAVLRKDCAGVLLYYYNWRLAIAPLTLHSPPLCHLWSLSVEEQFYLVWPAIVVLLLALGARRRWLLALVLAGVAGPALLRWIHLWAGHDPRQFLWYWRMYGCSDVRADTLSAGCLVGLLTTWGMLPAGKWPRRLLAAAAWLAVASLAVHLLRSTPLGSLYLFRWGFTLVALSAAVLVAALVAAPPWPLARLLEARPLRWVGRISYGTYLWHIPVLVVLARRPEDFRWPRVLLIWVASLAAGALSHYCLERPFLRLKQRFDRHGDPAGAAQRPTQPLQAAA